MNVLQDSSHNIIVKHARKAIEKQGAEYVLFQIDNLTDQVRDELAALKKRKMKVLYYITGEDEKIHIL